MSDVAILERPEFYAAILNAKLPVRPKIAPSGLRSWPTRTHGEFAKQHPWRRPIIIMGEFAPLRFRVGDRIKWGDQTVYVSGVNSRCIRVWFVPNV